MPSWRAVAALPQAERDYFDGMVADERAKASEAAEAERITKLQEMPDLQVIESLFQEAIEPHWDSYSTDAAKALRVLREAGFVREAPGFREGVTYNRGDRVLVRGRIYECRSDGVPAFYRCEGDPNVEVPRMTTPNWLAVGESA